MLYKKKVTLIIHDLMILLLVTVGKTRLAGSHLAILDFTPLAIIRPVCNVMVIYPSWLVKTGK